MLNRLVEKIDEIVDSIYTPEQPGIDKKVHVKAHNRCTPGFIYS